MSTSNHRSSNTCTPQNTSNTASKPIVQNNTHHSASVAQPLPAQSMYSVQPTNMGYVYFYTGSGSYSLVAPMQPPQAYMASTILLQPAQQFHYGPSGPTSFNSPVMSGLIVTPQVHPQGGMVILRNYTMPSSFIPQATMLPHAFQTMTLQKPTWNMDTGASSHLAVNTGMLTSFSNPIIYKFVFVGNVQSIPVTHMGHSLLHTSHKTLHLHHILVTPNIRKNLISVRQFTHENSASVEFDAYGFFMKDYQTCYFLLRCDSTDDLYPITQQPSSTYALLTFRAYVNKQFDVDIKALQCDHGGEYDNTRFHTLFRQHGIQFHFSYPKTSQQNGKSE
ncbi:ribonuclease H-like domain-containing protein, partial [Tanacetum coccineum]